MMCGWPVKEETMENTKQQPKILSVPLPEILDELEKAIQQVEEAVKASREAAALSAQRADEAKLSGKLAGEAAQKSAAAAVSQVEQKLSTEIAALKDELHAVSLVADGALALAQAMNSGIAMAVKGYNAEIDALQSERK
jgi:hypothetical protein